MKIIFLIQQKCQISFRVLVRIILTDSYIVVLIENSLFDIIYFNEIIEKKAFCCLFYYCLHAAYKYFWWMLDKLLT